MAKRGRKSKNNRNYFGKEQEEAVKQYILSESDVEKNIIFNKTLKPAFSKMIESIIRRYNLYTPDEDFKETFDDTISFLMTKIDKFKIDSTYKAYSYLGTICKNYLIYKINQFNKNQKRNERYDTMQSNFSDNIKYSYNTNDEKMTFLKDLISKSSKMIEKMINEKNRFGLNPDEIRVGKALIELMNGWETIFSQPGSNKFNKSSILLFLKETTMLNTKQIRDSMRKYKDAYYDIKEKMINF